MNDYGTNAAAFLEAWGIAEGIAGTLAVEAVMLLVVWAVVWVRGR